MGLFFHPFPFRATQPQPQPPDPRLVLPPIVRIYFLSADLSSPFFFASLPRELRRDFSTRFSSCPAPFSTLPALSPSLFRRPRIFVVPLFGISSASTSLAYPLHGQAALSISHLWSSLRRQGEGIGSGGKHKRKRNRRRVDFRSANVVSLLMNFSVR